jgi:hypothetical protein
MPWAALFSAVGQAAQAPPSMASGGTAGLDGSGWTVATGGSRAGGADWLALAGLALAVLALVRK